MRIIVAKVQTAEGLLGNDFLKLSRSATWNLEGVLMMRTCDGEVINHKLRAAYPHFACAARSVTAVVIPAGSHKLVKCSTCLRRGELKGQTVIAQPLVTTAYGVRIPLAIVEAREEVWIPVTNFNTVPLVIDPEWDLVTLEALEEGDTIETIPENDGAKPVASVVQRDSDDSPEETLPELLADLLSESIREIDDEEEQVLVRQLLVNYKEIFVGVDGSIGRTTKAEHVIDTGESRPIKNKNFRVSEAGHELIEKECESMMRKGGIRESFSPWSSPVVLVKKKNGEIRFCVDYRKLNEVTIKDSYPLLRIEDTLGALGGCQWFSTLDLASGFWQIPVKEVDKCKTAFATRMGLYEFNMMPFGLCNAPATFERLMERILRGINWRLCLVYIDDIIVGGKTVLESVERMELVFERPRVANLKLKPAKCNMFRTSVTFLGHVVSAEGIRPDPEKTKALLTRLPPSNADEVRSFLGMTGYYRDHIEDYAAVAVPIQKLVRKGVEWCWEKPQQEAFDMLITALTSDPVLGHPVHDQGGWIVDSDASGVALEAVLSQVQGGKEIVIDTRVRCCRKPKGGIAQPRGSC